MTAGYLGSRLREYISRERNESLPNTTKYTICRGQVSASEMALGVGMLLSITIFITPAARPETMAHSTHGAETSIGVWDSHTSHILSVGVMTLEMCLSTRWRQ